MRRFIATITTIIVVLAISSLAFSESKGARIAPLVKETSSQPPLPFPFPFPFPFPYSPTPTAITVTGSAVFKANASGTGIATVHFTGEPNTTYQVQASFGGNLSSSASVTTDDDGNIAVQLKAPFPGGAPEVEATATITAPDGKYIAGPVMVPLKK